MYDNVQEMECLEAFRIAPVESSRLVGRWWFWKKSEICFRNSVSCHREKERKRERERDKEKAV